MSSSCRLLLELDVDNLRIGGDCDMRISGEGSRFDEHVDVLNEERKVAM